MAGSLSNSAGLVDYITSRIDEIWTWDDHFRVLRELKDDIRALHGEDWSRVHRRLSRQHIKMRKRAQNGSVAR